MPKKTPAAHKCIYDFVSNMSGKSGVRVLSCIGDGTTDEAIEKRTKLKMSEIRNILNQLHNHGIVEYTREKNLANGWFTYTWKVNMDRAMRNFLATKKHEYKQLRDLMSAEEGAMFYKCRKGCGRLDFDRAMELKFKCPTCKSKMNYANNRVELKRLDEKISALENVLAEQNAFVGKPVGPTG